MGGWWISDPAQVNMRRSCCGVDPRSITCAMAFGCEATVFPHIHYLTPLQHHHAQENFTFVLADLFSISQASRTWKRIKATRETRRLLTGRSSNSTSYSSHHTIPTTPFATQLLKHKRLKHGTDGNTSHPCPTQVSFGRLGVLC